MAVKVERVADRVVVAVDGREVGAVATEALLQLDTLNRLRVALADQVRRRGSVGASHSVCLALDAIVADATGGRALLAGGGPGWRSHCPDCEALYVRLYQGDLF